MWRSCDSAGSWFFPPFTPQIKIKRWWKRQLQKPHSSSCSSCNVHTVPPKKKKRSDLALHLHFTLRWYHGGLLLPVQQVLFFFRQRGREECFIYTSIHLPTGWFPREQIPSNPMMSAAELWPQIFCALILECHCCLAKAPRPPVWRFLSAGKAAERQF